MGRPRLILKCIPNERDRNLAFMKRKKGLMKKMSEFSTMCKVDGCLIIYDGNGDVPPVTWPQDPKEVFSMIEKYERSKNEKPPKNFDIIDFYDMRKSVVESEISKVRKGTIKVQCPTWHPSLDTLGEEHLRSFIAILDAKLEACYQRIDMLKREQQIKANFIFLQNMYVSQIIDSNNQRGEDSQSQMLEFSFFVYIYNVTGEKDPAPRLIYVRPGVK